MQDFEGCAELAKTIGVKVEPLEGSDECRTLFYRANKLSAEEQKRVPQFAEAVDKRLEAAYGILKNCLQQHGEAVGALFDVAVRLSMWTTSPDDAASFSTLAVTGGLGSALVDPFIEVAAGNPEPDALRKEIARLDKAVEHELCFGDAGEAQGEEEP
jgi:hypothetical protein